MNFRTWNARLMAFALGAVAALALVIFAGTMFNALEPVGVVTGNGPVTIASVSASP